MATLPKQQGLDAIEKGKRRNKWNKIKIKLKERKIEKNLSKYL
jgi:hypothetical protein